MWFFKLFTKRSDMEFSKIVQLLTDLQSKIVELQIALADGETFAKAQYDAGFAAGVASVVLPDVQAQIDAAVAPLNALIVELSNKVNELQSQVDASAAALVAAVQAERERVLLIVDAETTDLKNKISLV
jgi:hypothetical protein